MSKQIFPVENGNQAPDNVTYLEDWRDTGYETLNFDHQTVRLSGHRVHTGDGSRYDVHVFEPEFQRYDTAVAFTTPWFTDLEGFNDRLGTSLARRGMTAIVISPERLTFNSIKHLAHFGELRHDAVATLDILDELEGPEHDLQVESGRTIIAGYSRGSMVGLGVNELSVWRGREIPYNYFVDPCLEHAVSLADVEKEGPFGYVGKEVQGLALALKNNNFHEWSDVPKTVVGVLRHFVGNLAVTPHIFSGEAGQFNPPQSMTALIRLYLNSNLNHHQSWQTRFSQYPNVRVQTSEGCHLTGSNPVVRQQTADNLQRIQQLLAEDVDPTELLTAVS